MFCRISDDEYSDDDDMSWKVRRASAKCLDALMSTRHEMLEEFYKTISPALINRFKGKENLQDSIGSIFHIERILGFFVPLEARGSWTYTVDNRHLQKLLKK